MNFLKNVVETAVMGSQRYSGGWGLIVCVPVISETQFMDCPLCWLIPTVLAVGESRLQCREGCMGQSVHYWTLCVV